MSKIESPPSSSVTGKITPHGVHLEPHEYNTVLFFTNLGKDIELIPPSNTPHAKRPDFIMDQLAWEAKSPTGNSTRMTIERILHKAARQSENIIIDLRHTKLPDAHSLACIKKYIKQSRRIKRVLVITKQEKLIDFKYG